jgi:pyridoxal phosphate enzyme (YggS family)
VSIAQNYSDICDKIDKACLRAGRKNNVKLIAVTKTRTVEEINQAISAGARYVGENRVQELLEKYDGIDKNADIHLIGQLQSNKVKYIIDKVDLIHSLDRISLAEQINKLAEQRNIAFVKTLIEVNIGAEPTKSGVLVENLTEYLDILTNFRYIKPIGLMTVAPALASDYDQNVYFEKMYDLLEQGKGVFGNEFSELSMGMSRDFENAIKHGSTMVRIGTALFGERNYNI